MIFRSKMIEKKDDEGNRYTFVSKRAVMLDDKFNLFLHSNVTFCFELKLKLLINGSNVKNKLTTIQNLLT